MSATSKPSRAEGVKLTKLQREVLFAACVGLCRKEDWPGSMWRTFDKLHNLGLVERRFPGLYGASFAGRQALEASR